MDHLRAFDRYWCGRGRGREGLRGDGRGGRGSEDGGGEGRVVVRYAVEVESDDELTSQRLSQTMQN